MPDALFLQSDLFRWVYLPLFIIAARVCDVSLGTIRIIFISRGIKYLAPIVGFFEVLIWLFAISQIMKNLNNVFYYVVYAGGFCAGTYVGLLLEEKLAIGVSLIRVIAQDKADDLIQKLKESGYGVTSIRAQGLYQPVQIIFTILKRREITRALALIKSLQPEAVYTIEDIRSASPTNFPLRPSAGRLPVLSRPLRWLRRSKWFEHI